MQSYYQILRSRLGGDAEGKAAARHRRHSEVISGAESAFGEGLALERELQQQLFESEDAREGIAANLEKRPPTFKGR